MVSARKENPVRQLGVDFVVARGGGPLKEALRGATGNSYVDVVGGSGFGEARHHRAGYQPHEIAGPSRAKLPQGMSR